MFQLKINHIFFFKSLWEQNITSPLTGVSDAYGSYRSYGSSLGILNFFADGCTIQRDEYDVNEEIKISMQKLSTSKTS